MPFHLKKKQKISSKYIYNILADLASALQGLVSKCLFLEITLGVFRIFLYLQEDC